MMRPLLLLSMGSALVAQSVSITSPTPAQTLSGYSGFSFAVSLSAAPSVALVCYVVDAYPAVTTDIGGLATTGCANGVTGFTLPWNSFAVWNGTHTVQATGYDSLGNVVATSSAVPFTVANTWPAAYGPGMTVATGTPLTSTWSGVVSVTPTITGSGASDSKNTTWYVDGSPIFADNSDTSVSPTYSIDTTKFSNGPHVVAVNSFDKTGGSNYNGTRGGSAGNSYAGMIAEWSATVTFSNGAVPLEFRSDARELFLASGQTHQLTPALVNTDGTTTAITPVYYSQNPAIATVSGTGLVTGVANGSAQIRLMAPTISGTDLSCVNTGCTAGTQYRSVSHPFTAQSLGQAITITSANGWTAGTYEINFASTNGQIQLSQNCTGANCPTVASPGAGSTGSATFSTGPSRTAWAFVNPTNAIYHFGKDASILNAYDPARSIYVDSAFQSASALPATATIGNDQPYNPGFLADYNSTGFNSLETGVSNHPAYTDVQSTWQANLTSSVASILSAISPFNFKFILTGDNWERVSTDLFAVTRGPSAAWSPAPMTSVLNAWAGKAIAIEWQDEVNSGWNSAPLQGPLQFGNGPTSIVASGGTCTVTWPLVSINATHNFLISGSVVANMNNPVGSLYDASSISASPFTFPCTGVANGTYNSANDPNLLFEPYATGWLNNTNGSTTSPNDYIRWNAFATFKSWINAANAGRPNADWPNAGSTNCSSVANWENPANGLADFATKYYAGFTGLYLSSRAGISGLIANLGDVSRTYYGCYSPNAPLLHQASAVPNNYGFQGIPLTVTSFNGNTVTFSSPHSVSNVLPGTSRITLSGMSNSADNGNYYILSTPTATSMTLVLAATDFVSAGTGGTLTFQNGDTEPLANFTATGTTDGPAGPCGTAGGSGAGSICSDTFSYTGSPDANVNRHRGQTFTATGVTGNSAFNTRTFFYLPENVQTPAAVFGNHYRELPQGASISGSAIVIPDNNCVLGRNAVVQLPTDPAIAFVNVIYTMILRGAGYRLYNTMTNQQGYNPTGGFVGPNGTLNNTFFGETSNQTVQLYAHPHWEDYYSVPDWRAVGLANLLNNRIAAYSLTASLPTPDYGAAFECVARTGAKGMMMACVNMTNAAQTRTFNLTPYLHSNQQIVRFTGSSTGITLATLNAGTSSDPETVRTGQVMIWLFPAAFATELLQPAVSARLADVASAVKVVARYGYDQYLLDAGNTVVDLALNNGVLPVDRNIGPVYYRLIYLDINGRVLATSDVQVL